MAGDTRDYRMRTTEALLREALSGPADDLTVTLDPVFQGLPEAAHGGTVLALFDALAGQPAAREILAHYRRRVPLAVPLRLGVARRPDAVEYRLLEGDALLVDGRISAAPAEEGSVTIPTVASTLLPISRTCFACGIDNAVGLRARLAFDSRVVGGTWTGSARFAGRDGTLAPLALTTLLDEAAFWLGVLATGESGMTTELRVRLHRRAPAAGLVRVGGERAAVRPRPGDPRYWETRVAAADAEGRLLASAAITFVAVRGAARRLVAMFKGLNPAEVVSRLFPTYTT